MFNERSLNLITEPTVYSRADYQRTLLILNALIPVIEAAVERLQYEWDKLAHIEIGDDTYVLKPNELGSGYTWEKVDYFDYDWYEDDTSSVEEDSENSTTKLAQSSTIQSTSPSTVTPAQQTPENATTQPTSQSTATPTQQTPENATTQPTSPSTATPTQQTLSNSNSEKAQSPPIIPDPWEEISSNSNNEQAQSVSTPFSTTSPPQSTPSNPTSQQTQASSPSTTSAPSSTETTQSTPTNSTSPSTIPAPGHIDVKHWNELVTGSAIAPGIASKNFKSLHQNSWQHEAWEYLFYDSDVPRINTGRLRNWVLEMYQHIEKGGWWCHGGVDSRCFSTLTPGEEPSSKPWGCYKPNEPRYEEKKSKKQKLTWPWDKPKADDKPPPPKKFKLIKYESPLSAPLSIFLLDVPEDIASKIYNKANVNPSSQDKESGFWYCVWKYNVPIIVTEGAKKTAAILSQGDAAIGLSGINGAYRTTDDKSNSITPHLREEFAMFATPGRDVKICFDFETKGETKRNVRAAIAQTGNLLEAAGANVSVVSLPGPQKGIDDLIVAHGSEAYQISMADALPLKEWKEKTIPHSYKFVIFLKDGREINLYEKQANGNITSNPANLDNEQVEKLADALQNNSSLAPIEDKLKTAGLTNNKLINIEPINTEAKSNSEISNNWAESKKIPNYVQNFPRRLLVQKENKDIALVAKKLLDQYGVQSDDGSLVYKAEGFTLRKFRDTYSIHRSTDEQESYFSFPLMQFEVDKKDNVKIIKPPLNMLAVEREEFLTIFNKGKNSELPSFYSDAIALKEHLGSLAPSGTQKVINNLHSTEVSQLLTNILSTADSKHLQVGSYRIKSEVDKQTGEEIIKLILKEKNQLERVAATFNTTTNSMTSMKLGEGDIENLRLIAKRVQVEYSSSQRQQTYNNYTQPENTNNSPPSSAFNNSTVPTNSSTSNAKATPKVSPEEVEPKRGYMGRVIKELLKQYGTAQADGSVVYCSQAYTFIQSSNAGNTSLKIYRLGNELAARIDNYQNEANSGTIKAWNITPQEKAVFIQLANTLNQGEQLPPLNAEPQTLRAALGDLSPVQQTNHYSPPKRQNNKKKSRDIEL